ncbi:MAG TPA: CPBP family intramembrane glutamic endopeptidase [Nitrospiraceae bacterium]|jgi:membrane protease YdiL (CAAX protease family)|nr:CPBP family intramembrane glutamic endopeptidase [Nitrospiraceae bacterium]
MMAPEPGPHTTPAQAEEWGAALALLPITATLGFYALPASLQEQTLVLFAPQILSYLALGFWAAHNRDIVSRLGLEKGNVRDGLRWGLLTGLLLGCLNTFVILSAYPHLGYDISFLKTTPHGRLPLLVMVPWFICGVALFVELNFRGFLLGRLAALESGLWRSGFAQRLSPLALIICALTFAFDPFMVNTFQHLHWIALWDGLIWGIIWLRTRNLCITIVAHAVEVIVMYSAVRMAIG